MFLKRFSKVDVVDILLVLSVVIVGFQIILNYVFGIHTFLVDFVVYIPFRVFKITLSVFLVVFTFLIFFLVIFLLYALFLRSEVVSRIRYGKRNMSIPKKKKKKKLRRRIEEETEGEEDGFNEREDRKYSCAKKLRWMDILIRHIYKEKVLNKTLEIFKLTRDVIEYNDFVADKLKEYSGGFRFQNIVLGQSPPKIIDIECVKRKTDGNISEDIVYDVEFECDWTDGNIEFYTDIRLPFISRDLPVYGMVRDIYVRTKVRIEALDNYTRFRFRFLEDEEEEGKIKRKKEKENLFVRSPMVYDIQFNFGLSPVISVPYIGTMINYFAKYLLFPAIMRKRRSFEVDLLNILFSAEHGYSTSEEEEEGGGGGEDSRQLNNSLDTTTMTEEEKMLKKKRDDVTRTELGDDESDYSEEELVDDD